MGRTRLDQGQAEQAEDAFRRALIHFAGDPRTASEQAQVWASLGEALHQQGDTASARSAQTYALALDPSLVESLTLGRASYSEPLPPLLALAEQTSGYLLRAAEELDAALTGLGRRLRLTYQVRGPKTGELHPLELRPRAADLTARGPAWGRLGRPAPVAAAYVRQLLAGALLETDFLVSATAQLPADSAQDEAVLEARWGRRPAPLDGAGRAFIRATLATSSEDGEVRLRHELLESDLLADEEEQSLIRRVVKLAPGDVSIAVLIEEMTSGAWGFDVVDLEDLSPRIR